MRLSVAVKAHPDRKALVDELVERLDGPAEVVWDRGLGNWDTSARAWAAYDPAADWHLVLEDDTIVCRDLVAGAARLLTGLPPRSVVSLYLGDHAHIDVHDELARLATESAASWIRGDRLIWGPAIAAPVGSVPAMLAWCDGRDEPYDTRLGRHYSQAGYPAYFTWPSLVDHAQVPSLLGHNAGRRARRFTGAEASALDFDPDGRVVYARGVTRNRKDVFVGKETDLLVARRTAALRLNGRRTMVQAGRTTAEPGADIVKENPSLWEPLTVDYPAESKSQRSKPVEQATAAPGEKRHVEPKAGDEPKPKRRTKADEG